jgi:general secretion pathway protein K
MSATDRRQRGLALIVVLWTVVLVALLASQLVGRTTEDLRLARNLGERSVLQVAADGGVRHAIALLARGEDGSLATGDGLRMTLGNTAVRVQADLEGGRVDLNAAPAELLEALILALGFAEPDAREGAELIASFRDGLSSGRGREARPFQMPIELTQVPGLSPEIWQRMLPYLTTFTGERLPLATTGLKPVRRALALLESGESTPSTSGPLWIGAAYRAEPAGAGTIPPERIVRITAEATDPGGARFIRSAIVTIHPGRAPFYTVLSWQNGRDTPP